VRLKITEQEPVVWSRQRRKTSSWLSGRLGWNRSINVSHNPLPSLALHSMDIMILPLLFLSTCLGHQIFASPPFFISNRFYLPKWIWPKFCHVWYIYIYRETFKMNWGIARKLPCNFASLFPGPVRQFPGSPSWMNGQGRCQDGSPPEKKKVMEDEWRLLSYVWCEK